MRALAFLLFAATTVVGCPETSGLEIMPLDDQRVRVNDTLIIDLRVRSAVGNEQWTFDAPTIPDIQHAGTLYRSGGTATFRWSPLASHAGTHQFTFIVASGGDRDTETINVEVVQAGGAPRFTQPGAGGAFDLGQNPCVDVVVEVIDEDDASVTITERDPRIEGAELTPTDGFHAQWRWCPTAQQVDASLRYTLHLEANDGHSPAVSHSFEIVLLNEEKPDCPGAAPVIASVTAQPRYETVRDYEVRAVVTDDQGLKDTPILYYSTTQPDPTSPDVTRMDTVPFGRATGDEYVAYVPNLSLAVAQEQTVYYVVSATDDDDAEGTGCDHRVMSTVGQFIAVEPQTPDLAGYCEHCTADRQCDGGLCVTGPPSFCGVDCGSGCAEGTCESVSSVSGSTDQQCVPEGMRCGGGGDCVDDAYEPGSDSATSAPTIGLDEMIEATMCQDDEDFYAFSLTGETSYDFTATGWDATTTDIDIALIDEGGDLRAWSAGTEDMESFAFCPETSGTYYLWVAPNSPEMYGSYLFEVTASGGGCDTTTCTDDYETNDDEADASEIECAGEETAATICEGDEDWFRVEVTGPSELTVVLVCDPGGGDIDLYVKDDSSVTLASSRSDACDEDATVSLPRAGSYFVRIDGYGDATADYSFLCEATAGGGCTDTRECPAGTVCDGASGCVDDVCDEPGSPTACPAGHFCPETGGFVGDSFCVDDCWSAADCRTGYDCKVFEEGRGCAEEGEGMTGELCEGFWDCAGERICVGTDAYCAEIGCTSNSDCPTDDPDAGDARCINIAAGLNACLKDCWMGDELCDSTMGSCTETQDVDGDSQYACVAEGMTVPPPP